MVNIGDLIRLTQDLSLQRLRQAAVPAVAENPHTYLVGQIQSLSVLLQKIDDAQRLLIVSERMPHHLTERNLSGMAKRRMTQVMSESDRLGQILIETQCTGNGSRNTRNLQRVRHTGTVVIALRL